MNAETMQRKKLRIYSDECLELLRQALAKAEAEVIDDESLPIASAYHKTRNPHHMLDGSSEDEYVIANDENSSSSPSSSSETEQEDEAVAKCDGSNTQENEALDKEETGMPRPQRDKSSTRKKTSKSATRKQRESLIHQLGTPPCCDLPYDDLQQISLPASLLDQETRVANRRRVCQSYLDLALEIQEKPIVVLELRSGRFAGGIFHKDRCLVHRASTRYTIRKGQGKAQSAQDNQRRPKSVGSQLRRAGEQALRDDVKRAMQDWSRHIADASLVLISCPKVMLKSFFEDAGGVLMRDDSRIRKIPFNVGRPTFESVSVVHEVLMTAIVGNTSANKPVESPPPIAVNSDLASAQGNQGDETSSIPKPAKTEKQVPAIEINPLTPFHTFSSEGNLTELLRLIDTHPNPMEAMNVRAGEDFMTPLHYAATSHERTDPTTAAACVTALLVQANANPCLHDARHRVPYFLASHDKVRDAFRMARATLGEDSWAWDDGAKVGPPLTLDDLQKKKEKAADKKKRQRARQKDQKAKQKAQMEEAERERKLEEETREAEKEAKRIREGLQPKTVTATNACDFCQKICRGKRRSQMFQRLEYAYCSTDCVNKHKRELMAKAAMARLGG